MAEKYFEKFQQISYSNTVSVNLTERAALLNKVSTNPYIYYPYDITNGERPDQISDQYYNDQFMSWIIYFSNDTIDPYYQWYMSNEEFNTFLKKKYNLLNIDVLKQKVVFYRNNWYKTERITVAAFNALTVGQQKYWQPVYGSSNSPLGYERDQKDWTLSTNKVVSYDISVANNTFINGEITKVYLANTFSGNGQVAFSNTSNLKLHHIFGNTYANAVTGYVYGTESGTNVEFTAATLVIDNIPADEDTYWDPVYVYDVEEEKNEQNKSIRLLDSRYASQFAIELENILK